MVPGSISIQEVQITNNFFSLEKNHIPLICSVPLLFHRVAHVIYEETILHQYIITKRSELLFLP